MENELAHHGITGMKWGIRRYQNKNGTLTASGKKRYDKEMAKVKSDQKTVTNQKRTASKLEKLESEKKKLSSMKEESRKTSGKSSEKQEKKTFSNMSDDELRERINRMAMERQAYDLQKQLSSINPKQVSAGEKFVKGVIGDVVAPALKDAGKNLATDYIKKVGKKKLGLDVGKSELDKLKEESEKLGYKKKISEINDYYERRSSKQAESKKKQPDTKKTDQKESDKKEDPLTGTVFGEGKSTYRPKDSPIYDADYTDVKDSQYAYAGEQYLKMLEEKKK